MEKKSYYRPVISTTEIDYSINVQLISQNTPPPPIEEEIPPLPEYINPFKWLR